MRIPTLPSQPSMNLGQAVAVILYELARPLKLRMPTAAIAGASSVEIERLTNALFEALTLSGYLKSESSPFIEEKIRRVVRRVGFSAEDLPVWLGMFRQIIWKIRRDAIESR
jgi:tRNA/rRNA methyltransferase